MNSPIRIGAIGCGGMSVGCHFPSIQRVPELKLVALCDIDEDRLQAAAAEFGVTDTYADFEQMLDSGKVDAVSIVGPPSLHVLGARACLTRQIPFMTEKPLALNVADAQQLAELAAKHGDCGQVGYTNRFSPSQRLAWHVSRSAEFGAISYVATTHLHTDTMTPVWDKTDLVEGSIHKHGVHAIDLWRFFGGDPVEVSASVAGMKMLDPADAGARGSVLAYVRTADGPHGTIQMKAGASHEGDINVDVMGENSRVRVENNQVVTYERLQDWITQTMAGDPLADTFHREQPVGQFVGTGQTVKSYADFFRCEWLAFARALLDGMELSPSIVDGYKTVCLTEAICASLRNGGAPVKVTY